MGVGHSSPYAVPSRIPGGGRYHRNRLAYRPAVRHPTEAARRLTEQGHGARVLLEGTAKPAQSGDATLGFYAWGASDPAQRRRTTGMTFAPGAIAASLASANARTFTQPPDNWMPAGSGNPATFFAGSAETLAGDLVRDGVTGVSGQVDEPASVAPSRSSPTAIANESSAAQQRPVRRRIRRRV